MAHLLVEYKENNRLVATVRTNGREINAHEPGDYELGIVLMGFLIGNYGFRIKDNYALPGEQKATILEVGISLYDSDETEIRADYIKQLIAAVANEIVLEGQAYNSSTEVIVMGEFEGPLTIKEVIDVNK